MKIIHKLCLWELFRLTSQRHNGADSSIAIYITFSLPVTHINQATLLPSSKVEISQWKATTSSLEGTLNS